MTRSPWAESLNLLRPRPFDRSTGPMVVLDEAHGRWLHWVGDQVECLGEAIWEPWRAWILPRDARPTIHRSESQLQFLSYPLPTHLVDSDAVYCRNLDVVTTSVSLWASAGVRLDASTLEPVYDPDCPIYYTNDNWQTWGATSCVTVNMAYPGVTGATVQLAWRSPAVTDVAQVEGTSDTPQFSPLWNSFDERGRWADLPRLDGEHNRLYLERLRSRMAAPGGPDVTGVAIDTARRLGRMEYVDWPWRPLPGSHLVWLKDVGDGPSCSQGTLAAGSVSLTGSGLRGTCLEFSASSAATIIWSDSMAALAGGTFGLSVWLATAVSDDVSRTVVQRGEVRLWLQNGVAYAGISGVTLQSVFPDDGRWHQLSVDYNGTTLQLGVDGQVRDASSLVWELSGTTDWTMGGGFIGRLDELRIFAEAFTSHEHAFRQLIPTDGWPVMVAGVNGPLPGIGRVENDRLTMDEDEFWRGQYPIRAPFLVQEYDDVLETATSDGTGRVTLPSRTSGLSLRSPTATYQVRWWYGNEAVIPDQLPMGRYRTYVAYGVRALSLAAYRLAYLTDARGLLTDRGQELLAALGEPVVWETRIWDENLYLYDSMPPFAPAQTTYDQDLIYDA